MITTSNKFFFILNKVFVVLFYRNIIITDTKLQYVSLHSGH